MNITFQLELNTSNASKEGRVLIRCTQNRKHKRISTGVAVASNFWDKVRHKVKKTHPMSNELNNLIQEKLRKVTTIYTKLLSEQDEVTLDEIIMKMTTIPMTNFFDFAYSTKMEEIKSRKKIGTYRRYEAVLNKLKDYAGAKLTLNQINYAFLQKYMIHLKTYHNNSQDTISANLSAIRTILNEAIKHELYKGNNPFNQIKTKYTDNTKEKLTIEEIKRIFTYPLPKIHSIQIARDFFLACFLAEGTRGGDMIAMRKEYISDGFLVFNQQKTGTKMLIPITPELNVIFEKYIGKGAYIFPFLNEEKIVNEIIVGNKLAYINKYLKEVAKYCGIFKKLSTHVARHTFTDLALEVSNGNIYQVQKSLGHSSIKTTELYSRNRVNYNKKSVLPDILKSIQPEKS
jgi:integrase/recombinase XerD